MDQQHTAGARKYLKLTKTKYVCEQYTWHIHGTYNITVWGSTVQYSQVIKFRLFFIFTHAPCGNVSQQMDIFSSSSNSFQPLTFCSYLAEKKTQVLFPPVTRDQPDMT